jgi:hypothetical protein
VGDAAKQVAAWGFVARDLIQRREALRFGFLRERRGRVVGARLAIGQKTLVKRTRRKPPQREGLRTGES